MPGKINGTALRHLRAGAAQRPTGCLDLSWGQRRWVHPAFCCLPAFFFFAPYSAVSYYFFFITLLTISHGVSPTLCSLFGTIAFAFSLPHLSLYLPFTVFLVSAVSFSYISFIWLQSFLFNDLSLINAFALPKHAAVPASSWDCCSLNGIVAELAPLLLNSSPLSPVSYPAGVSDLFTARL